MNHNYETTTRISGTAEEQKAVLLAAKAFDRHFEAETHYIFPGLADFSRECPEEIEIKTTFTKYAYTESEFRQFYKQLAESAPCARFYAETHIICDQFNLAVNAMLEDGILKIFHSDTDLIEAEGEFRKEFADILPFEQFQDILKTDSYIPDAEDYESLIRFAIKEKTDLSLPEFGFEEFRNALGKHISNDAILIAMKSGCFNTDSFNRFCEWGIFNHNGSFCYDPVRKKELYNPGQTEI